MAERIDSIGLTKTRRKLLKSPEYLFFDLGVRRVSVKEGVRVSEKMLGQLYELFVGMELSRMIYYHKLIYRQCYWRDHAGPEVKFFGYAWRILVGRGKVDISAE